MQQKAIRAQENYHKFVRSRLEMMRGYAEVRDCRRKYLLNYFGETLERTCNLCDNCQAGIIVQDDGKKKPFPLNSHVVHTSWGKGEVMRYENDKIVVLFDKVGYKTLGVELVLLRALLKRID